MNKFVQKLMIKPWKNSRLIRRLDGLFRLILLIIRDKDICLHIRLLMHHLSHWGEVSPNQFFESIANWSRNLVAWHRLTVERERNRITPLRWQPKVTIITPIFGAGGGLIKETLESVRRQQYRDWELYLFAERGEQFQLSKLTKEIFNGNQEVKIKISSDVEENLVKVLNEALNECKGDFIGFLSGSDRVAENALFDVVNLLNQDPDANVIYSDEAERDKETLIRLFYKPSWSRDLFLSVNYLRNFLCCKTEVIRGVGGFSGNFEDDIKYDLILRIIEKEERVRHIPKILYYEQIPKCYYPKQFTADYSFELHKRALQEYIERVGIQGKVSDGVFKGSFRVRRKILGEPKVTIIIPTKNNADQLKRCIESIECKTIYPNFEIIIIDNSSTEHEVLQYLRSSPHKIIQYPEKFNFSKINNFASRHATGEYLLFLNDDTQVISPEWLEAMLEHAQREEIGIVGAKLLYPNGLIQHAGVVLECNQVRHMHRFANLYDHGYFGMADLVHNLNSVTGACLMIRKNVFEQVGGFEQNLPVIYNDIDLCLKVRSRGYLIVYTPYALLYHHEGTSRWSDLRKEAESANFFYSQWNAFIQNDISFNPNYGLSGYIRVL